MEEIFLGRKRDASHEMTFKVHKGSSIGSHICIQACMRGCTFSRNAAEAVAFISKRETCIYPAITAPLKCQHACVLHSHKTLFSYVIAGEFYKDKHGQTSRDYMSVCRPAVVHTGYAICILCSSNPERRPRNMSYSRLKMYDRS